VLEREGRFRTDRSQQLFIDEPAGTASRLLSGPLASRPRDGRVGPGGNHNVGVSEQADGTIATFQRWGTIRAVQELEAVGIFRGVCSSPSRRPHSVQNFAYGTTPRPQLGHESRAEPPTALLVRVDKIKMATTAAATTAKRKKQPPAKKTLTGIGTATTMASMIPLPPLDHASPLLFGDADDDRLIHGIGLGNEPDPVHAVAIVAGPTGPVYRIFVAEL
jgi:hypothetical protein